MLYAGSGTLAGLGYVVMDEVHYLADRSRGAVWEEVIIHLPESVALVSLSATVSNAEEFGEWLETVRGDTATIVEERRPVPLYQHVMVGRRMLDLFAPPTSTPRPGSSRRAPRSTPSCCGSPATTGRARRMRDRRHRAKGAAGSGRGADARRRQRPTGLDPEPGRRPRPARRAQGLLPAIVFIFSRVGCDAAVAAVPARRHPADHARGARRDPRLRRGRVRRPARRGPARPRLPRLPRRADPRRRRPPRRHAAGVQAVRRGALRARPVQGGVRHRDAGARHQHAGPHRRHREASKWNGETHADITPGEYTQLTGRAGRRGLDVEGHARRALAAGHEPARGGRAGLHADLSAPLELPAVVQHGGQPRAPGRPGPRARAAGDVVRPVPGRQGRGRARPAAGQEPGRARRGTPRRPPATAATSWSTPRCASASRELERNAARARRADRREEVLASLEQLHRGDVIQVPGGKFAGLRRRPGPAARRPDGPRPQVLTAERQARRLSVVDFPAPVTALSRLRIPTAVQRRATRRCGATWPRPCAPLTHGLTPAAARPRARRAADAGTNAEIEDLRRQLREHPCHDCPDREDHARWAERWIKLDRDARTLEATRRAAHQHRGAAVRPGLRRARDARLPRRRRRDGPRPSAAPDLLRARPGRRRVAARRGAGRPRAVRAGRSAVDAGLRGPAARGRRLGPRSPVATSSGRSTTWSGSGASSSEVEREHRLDFLRRPDAGLAWAAYRWAEGDDLADVLDESDLTAGDFVRWIKQLIDLCGPGGRRRRRRAAPRDRARRRTPDPPWRRGRRAVGGLRCRTPSCWSSAAGPYAYSAAAHARSRGSRRGSSGGR